MGICLARRSEQYGETMNAKPDGEDTVGPSSANTEAMSFPPECCRVTLASISDAVITTDTEERVTFLESVTKSLSGWTQDETAGGSPESVVPRDGAIVGLTTRTRRWCG